MSTKRNQIVLNALNSWQFESAADVARVLKWDVTEVRNIILKLISQEKFPGFRQQLTNRLVVGDGRVDPR